MISFSGQSINVIKHTIFHRQISVNRSSFRFLCTQGLIVSEISTRHQKGYTEWVLAACGPFAACVHSVLRFAFAVLTNAVYATLFFQYLEHVWMTCFLLSMTSPSFFLLNKNIQKQMCNSFLTAFPSISLHSFTGIRDRFISLSHSYHSRIRGFRVPYQCGWSFSSRESCRCSHHYRPFSICDNVHPRFTTFGSHGIHRHIYPKNNGLPSVHFCPLV